MSAMDEIIRFSTPFLLDLIHRSLYCIGLIGHLMGLDAEPPLRVMNSMILRSLQRAMLPRRTQPRAAKTFFAISDVKPFSLTRRSTSLFFCGAINKPLHWVSASPFINPASKQPQPFRSAGESRPQESWPRLRSTEGSLRICTRTMPPGRLKSSNDQRTPSGRDTRQANPPPSSLATHYPSC